MNPDGTQTGRGAGQAGRWQPGAAGTEQRDFHELPPLGLYIHLPWCVRKCPYCDFNSHEARGDIPEVAYVQALLADLEQELPEVWGRTVASVFIGGGTPSLFSAAALDRLFSGLRALIPIPPTVEITMEANPGTFEQARFSDFRAIGINRLSIGVQSFDDTRLDALGRIHSGKEAQRAIDIAHTAGFENLNLDLMFGLPGQTLAAASQDLATAIALQPTHLSRYELTLEPNTRFAKYPPERPDDDTIWRMQVDGENLLQAAGFKHYEISAFARPRHECEHNRNYWEFGDYLGIGAGAHGKISMADSGEIRRRWKVKHPSAYLESAAGPARIGGESVISLADTGLEFMMNALRLVNGFDMPLFRAHTGVSLDRWQPAIADATARGLLEQHGLQLRPTGHGLQFLNDLLGCFMEEPAAPKYPVINLRPA